MFFSYIVIALWLGAAGANIHCNVMESEGRDEECIIDRNY